MMDLPRGSLYAAVEDFRRARRQAALEEVGAFLTGRSAKLLSFDDVSDKLITVGSRDRGLTEIPLDAIVGSVGRYTDFTRSFLPRKESDQERWATVQMAITDLGKFPPIELYQIGEGYFVVDGNHRVSIARRLGADSIQAYVTEIKTKVPLQPDDQPDDLIVKAEYADFLDATNLDILRPGADLRITLPGRYGELQEEIRLHTCLMEQRAGGEVTPADAVADWYDSLYLPAVGAIRQTGILQDFPGRTEADLYVWLSRHREQLQETLGWAVSPDSAASDLAVQHGNRPGRIASRIGEKLREALLPPELEGGPNAGQWRRERVTPRHSDFLFPDILVPVSGEATGWNALEQALIVAQREQGRLIGLHIVPTEERASQPDSQAVREGFNHRCEAAGIPGQLVITISDLVAPVICDRARWADLVTVNLAHPPSSQPMEKLKSGFRTLLRRCPRPVLATPETVTPLRNALLAFDGSPKGQEALFVAAYLASRWGIELHVITVVDKAGGEEPAPLAAARSYLEEQGVAATYVHERGPVARAIMGCAASYGNDLIIMGGYGFGTVREVVLGSSVDQVLRESRLPLLICR